MSTIQAAMHCRHIARLDDMLSLTIDLYNQELAYIERIYINSQYGATCEADVWAIRRCLQQFAVDICNHLHVRTTELTSHAGTIYRKIMQHRHTDIVLRARKLLKRIKDAKFHF